MATPISKSKLSATLAGVALTLGASAVLLAADAVLSDAWAQESRRPGGGEGRQFEPGAGPRGSGAGPRAGGMGGGERGGAEGRRPGGERGAGATADETADRDEGARGADAEAPAEEPAQAMQFDTSPVQAGGTTSPAAPVRAAAARAAQSNGWLDEIAEIEARVALLEKREDLDARLVDSQIRRLEKRAELEILQSEGLEEMMVEAKKSLREKRAELDKLIRESTATAVPAVVSIVGAKGRYESQLYFQSGRFVYAREGDLVAPGVRVTHISPAGVEVSMRSGESGQPQQVLLDYVSLPERRGENDEADGGAEFHFDPTRPPSIGALFGAAAAARAAATRAAGAGAGAGAARGAN